MIEFNSNTIPTISDSHLAIPQRQLFLSIIGSGMVTQDPNNMNGVRVYDYRPDKGLYLTAAHKLQIIQIIDEKQNNNNKGTVLRCKIFI